MKTERLEFLLNRYFDLALATEEKAELEGMLLGSAEARATFWELARWHAALRQWGEEEEGRRDVGDGQPPLRVLPAPPPKLAAPRPVRKAVVQAHARSRSWWPALAAAAAVALGVFGWMKWGAQPSALGGSGPRLAVLTNAGSAVWAEATVAPQTGAALRAGWLKLKSGAITLEFARGARVALEGPAELELRSDNSGTLRFGKLVATVPQSAHGFTLAGGNFSVTDYGTKFGCNLPPGGLPEVHVFRGAVGLETSKAKVELRENQARRLAEAQWQEIPVARDAFLIEEKLALGQWQQSHRAFSQRPGMLAHFDFEAEAAAGQTLPNHAPHAPNESKARIIGSTRAEGRWPGKGALEFKQADDRLRLALPGEFQAITFLAWVRADRLAAAETSLLRPDVRNALGETNWYIARDGALGWSTRVAPRGSAEQWRHARSAPVFRGAALGSWHLVATVFDGASVTHYFDGEAVGSMPVRLPAPVRLGTFEIGNTSNLAAPDNPAERAAREMIGNFIGRIDELAILAEPLRAEEIRRLYEEGRPVEN